MLKIDEAPEVTDVGIRVALTPLGAPETDKPTVCAVPPVVAVEIVLPVLFPAMTETDNGLALIEKSFVPTLQLFVAGAIQLAAALENSCWTT
jgi:hypothetical protein